MMNDDTINQTKNDKLTPHTLRLIRLITSSSNPKSDTTVHAISLLSKITSRSNPSVLWDIIARLYGSLTNDCCDSKTGESTTRGNNPSSGSGSGSGSSSEKGRDALIVPKRESVALAIEHVARFIPIADQRDFLTQDDSFNTTSDTEGDNDEKSVEKKNEKDEQYLWLRVTDLLPQEKSISSHNDVVESKQFVKEDWEALNLLLTKGRLLLSSTGSQYDCIDLVPGLSYEDEYRCEGEMLSTLDQNAASKSTRSSNDIALFVKERVQLQRAILARRLGFGGIFSKSLLQQDNINHGISDEDLVKVTSTNCTLSTTNNISDGSREEPVMTARQRNLQRLKKRRQNHVQMKDNDGLGNKKIKTTEKDGMEQEDNDDDDDQKSNIRKLLLFALQNRSQDSSSSFTYGSHHPSSTAVSHQNPQTLLATDMIYHTFHPSWHVRHGALLGLLAILRSWNKTKTPSIDLEDSKRKHSFGKWPHDILTRCLCILALDRFGDYSGSTLPTLTSLQGKSRTGIDNDNKIMVSMKGGGEIVTPVRETAAQVIALLLAMAPTTTVNSNFVNLQHSCFQVLNQLVQYEKEWEVRNGAMLAFKYIAALLKSRVSFSNHPKGVNKMNTVFDSCWDATPDIAIKGLSDASDDVRGVAAQVLSCILEKPPSNSQQTRPIDDIHCIIRKCVGPLWIALENIHGISSCAIELLQLFTKAVSSDCELVLQTIGSYDGANSHNKSVTPIPCENTIMELLMQKMLQFLLFDSPSVRFSCLVALRHITIPILEARSAPMRNKTVGNILDATDAKCNIIRVYCDIMLSIFNSFFGDASTDRYDTDIDSEIGLEGNSSESRLGENQEPENPLFVARNQAWESLINAIPFISSSISSPLEENILCETLVILLLRLVDIGPMTTTPADTSTCRTRRQMSRLGNARRMVSGKLSAYYSSVNAASRALSTLCAELTISRMNQILSTALHSFLRSPWPEICETGCILIKNMAMVNKKKTHLLQEFRDVLISMLDSAPICMIVSANTSDCLHEDDSVISLCDEILISALYSLTQQTANLGQHDDNFEGSNSDRIYQVWTKAFASRGVNITSINCRKINDWKATITSVRLSASLCGAIIALKNLPPRLTPLIRALMTSVKNEDTTPRSRTSCESLVELLRIISSSEKDCQEKAKLPATSRVKEKLISNMCSMASVDTEALSTLPPGVTSFGCETARLFLQLLVTNIDKEETIENINPLWQMIKCLESSDPGTVNESELSKSIIIFCCISSHFSRGSKAHLHIISRLLPTVSLLACASPFSNLRQRTVTTIIKSCKIDADLVMGKSLPILMDSFEQIDDDSRRLGACILLDKLVSKLGVRLCPFVRTLLPTTMSMMTDHIEECAHVAASTFACLVRLAPLVDHDSDTIPHKSNVDVVKSKAAEKVVDHLIKGEPLPPCNLPFELEASLKATGINLRKYQREGVTWLSFLRSVKLNGALCDDMGLGKTLQALISIYMAHSENLSEDNGKRPRSLIVCPSSIVGHWAKEVKRLYSNSSQQNSFEYTGALKERKKTWDTNINNCDIIITSYSILRSDINMLRGVTWTYCVLDEGHLLKNPKTKTAKAARCLRSKHRLILSGTPVQNKVHELWATFDFLMPNFLGSETNFSQWYAKDIVKGNMPGASESLFRVGMEKLKALHQQVLPFILRREKSQVLQDLPPKIIADIPCSFTIEQSKVYNTFCADQHAQRAMTLLDTYLNQEQDEKNEKPHRNSDLEKNSLVSLFYLRLVCTHPALLKSYKGLSDKERSEDEEPARFDASGKLLALNDLLRTAGIVEEEMTAVDNDDSLLYIKGESDFESGGSTSAYEKCLNDASNEESTEQDDLDDVTANDAKCLIFAQFTQSLDIIEQTLFRPHMPSLRYLRIDGNVSPKDRTQIVDRFNKDESIKCMLLTTKVGGLGLNLQSANVVIFLEPDWNPHADLQAMDRVHRIGQQKTVQVYRLVTSGSIEEKIMELQKLKIRMSDAIVNSDNSTMFSMGTDRLLDIFTENENTSSRSQVVERTSQGNLDEIEYSNPIQNFLSEM